MKAFFIIVLLAFLTCQGVAFGQSTDTGAQSRGLFRDVLSNTTKPGVVNGARRGEIFGGSFEARNKLMHIHIASFEMPRIAAGCGGINAFMGSFSFISKAQLVAALRSIATAAVGYAFQLALSTMCPDCESIMSELQGKMDTWTQNGISTCHVAQSLLNAGGTNSIAARIKRDTPNVEAAFGYKSDHFSAMGQGANTTPSQDLQSRNPQAADTLGMGNIVWQALKAQSAAIWATTSSNSAFFNANNFLEDVQSLTGTIVVCTTKDTDCGGKSTGGKTVGQNGNLITEVWSPTMDLDDLVFGSTKGKSVARLTCVGKGAFNAHGCTQIKRVEDTHFIGLKGEILTIMLGTSQTTQEGFLPDTGLGSTDGMIADIQAGHAPTAREKALLEFGGQDIQMAVRIAMVNPYAAVQFVNQFASQMAADMAMHIVVADLDLATTSIDQDIKANQNLDPIRKMIHRAVRKNMAIEAKISRNTQVKSGIMTYYQALLKEVSHPLKYSVPSA